MAGFLTSMAREWRARGAKAQRDAPQSTTKGRDAHDAPLARGDANVANAAYAFGEHRARLALMEWVPARQRSR